MRTRFGVPIIGGVGLAAIALGIGIDWPRSAPAHTPEPPIAQAARTAIVNVRVFDGERTWPRATVVLDGDHIAGIGADIAVPSGAAIVDGTGRTLVPGFIDAHAHASGDALERAVLFGVTTELDMFTDPDFAAKRRAEERQGRVTTRADLRSAGILVTAPGGHGTEFGMPIPTLARAEDARAFVAARIAEGSDYIKLVKDNGSPYGLNWPTLTDDEVAATVAAAHWYHTLVVSHIGTQADAVVAIDASVDGLAHLFQDSPPRPDFAARVAAHHAFVVPTLTVLEGETGRPSGAGLISDPDLGPLLLPTESNNLRSSFHLSGTSSLSLDHARATVASLKAAGVPILVGTDAPNPGTAHGVSLHRELELLVSAGLTPAEALAAATSVPARLFGLLDRGRIAPGLRADVVLVRGEPDRDILATRAIVRVWRNGAVVAR
jgi:imidazolonepropionase-like amidohydrolase